MTGWKKVADEMFTKLKECEHQPVPRDDKYKIPEFGSQFSYYYNPINDNVPLMTKIMDWWFEYSLLPKEFYEKRIREACLLSTTYFWPFCTNERRYELLVKWIGYLFVFDDHVETKYGEFARDTVSVRPVLEQTMKCVEKLESKYVLNDKTGSYISMAGWKPYVLATYAIVKHILQDYNLDQRKRFLHTWKVYLRSNDRENVLIEKQIIDLEQVKKARLDSGAMKTTFALIEYADNIFVPVNDWEDLRIQRLMDLCNLSTVFVNDLYSFEKEYLEQSGQMEKMLVNIVGFHVLKEKCSIERAMQLSISIIRQCDQEYAALSKLLMADDTICHDTKWFIRGLTAINGGNFKLSIRANRYNNIYVMQQ